MGTQDIKYGQANRYRRTFTSGTATPMKFSPSEYAEMLYGSGNEFVAVATRKGSSLLLCSCPGHLLECASNIVAKHNGYCAAGIARDRFNKSVLSQGDQGFFSGFRCIRRMRRESWKTGWKGKVFQAIDMI